MLNNLEKWTTLHDSITSRINALDGDTILKHHVNQFGIFCENAEKCLRDYQNGPETEVIDLLALQWKRLDNVASLYLKSSQYYSRTKDLEEFNTQAGGYCGQLCRALPEGIINRLSLSAPLFYFEDASTDLAKLTLLRERLPALISIPGNNPGEPLIAYEVSRAFFGQLPGFLPELKARVQSHLPHPHEIIIDWLADIVAKLTGIALLFDLNKTKQHLLTPARPDIAHTEITDPVALLLPYIGLEALQGFLNHFMGDEKLGDKTSGDLIEQIKKDVDELLGERLNKQYEFIPNATGVALKEVQDTMLNVVRLLLSAEMALEALGGKSLFDVLIACAEDKPENTKAVLSEWGVISDAECQQFVMRLPDLLRPLWALPLPFSCRPVFFMTPLVPSFTWLDILKEIFG